MHSAINRAQSVFGFFTTLAAVLGLLTAVSVVLYPGAPISSVELTNVQVYVFAPPVLELRHKYYRLASIQLQQVRTMGMAKLPRYLS